jgi:hypothetical protein
VFQYSKHFDVALPITLTGIMESVIEALGSNLGPEAFHPEKTSPSFSSVPPDKCPQNISK